MKHVPTLLLMLLAVAVVGCSGSADKSDSATDAMKKLGDDAAATVNDMTEAGSDMLDDAADKIDQLPGTMKDMAQEYYDEIKNQQSKLDDIKATLSEMSPQDLMSEKGQELKKQSDKVTAELTKLKSKLQELLDQGGEG